MADKGEGIIGGDGIGGMTRTGAIYRLSCYTLYRIVILLTEYALGSWNSIHGLSTIQTSLENGESQGKVQRRF